MLKKIILLILVFIISYVNVLANDYDKYSPYVIYENLQGDMLFGNMPSIINPDNIPLSEMTALGCRTLNEDEKIRVGAPLSTFPLICPNFSQYNLKDTLFKAFQKAKVTNMIGIGGKSYTDLNSTRWYITQAPIKVTNKSNLEIDMDTGDIWYIPSTFENASMSSQSYFGIYDPDLSNDNGFEGPMWGGTDGANGDVTPGLSVSLYALDSARISNTLLSKGVYTMEHFLGKKYPTNNGNKNTYRTTTYDGQPLYDFTYFNETTLPTKDFYRFCNTALYNAGSNSILVQNALFDNIENYQNKTGANKQSRTSGKCASGTSGLRLNTSGNNLGISRISNFMNERGSIKFDSFLYDGSSTASFGLGGYLGEATNSNHLYGDYERFFSPVEGDSQAAMIKLPEFGLVGNYKLINGLAELTSEEDIKDTIVSRGMTFNNYFAVKMSLQFKDYEEDGVFKSNTTQSSKLNNLISENYKGLGFDPTVESSQYNWYDESHHIQSKNDPVSRPENKILSPFSNPNYTGDGNMYIPFGIKTTFFGMNSPGYIQKTEQSGYSEAIMNKRSFSLSLSPTQGYIWTEQSGRLTSAGQPRKSGVNFGITSFGNFNSEYVPAGVKPIIMSNRNIDSDSGIGELLDDNLGLIFYSRSDNKDVAVEYISSNNDSSSTYGLDGFNTHGGLDVKKVGSSNLGTCDSMYGVSGIDIWSVVLNTDAVKCGRTEAGARLSYNFQTGSTKGVQQSFEGIVSNISAVDSGNTDVVTTSIYENVNDQNSNTDTKVNYNLIATTSQFLENIPEKKINCSINISKAFWKDNAEYMNNYNAGTDLNTNSEYSKATKYFTYFHLGNTGAGQQINSLLDRDKITPYHFGNIKGFNQDLGNLNNTEKNLLKQRYQAGEDTMDFLLGEKGFITYTCNNIPAGKEYMVEIKHTNEAFEEESYGSLRKIPNGSFFSHGETLLELNDLSYLATTRKGSRTTPYVGMNEETGSSSLNGVMNNYDFGGGLKETFYSDTPASGNNESDASLSFSTDQYLNDTLGTVDGIMGGIEFKTNNITNGSEYGNLYVGIYDVETYEEVATESIFIGVKDSPKTLTLEDALKNEQTLPSGYTKADYGFKGNSGDDYGLSITFRNAGSSSMEVPVGATAGGNNMFVLGNYNNIGAATESLFPIINDIANECSTLSDYNCAPGTNNNQKTSDLYKILKEEGDGTENTPHIKIIEKTPTNPTGTAKIAQITNSVSSLNSDEYTIFNGGSAESLMIFFPTNENNIKGNTSYEIQIVIPDNGYFDDSSISLWNDDPKVSNDALMIVPSVGYLNQTAGELRNWDVDFSSFVSSDKLKNLIYKPEAPQNQKCLQPLVPQSGNFTGTINIRGTDVGYTFNNGTIEVGSSKFSYSNQPGLEFYLSDAAAEFNGKSCSDSGVHCIIDVNGIISDANLGYSTTEPYSGLSQLGDGSAQLGEKYSILAEMESNLWYDIPADAENNAMEIFNYKFPLEVTPSLIISNGLDASQGVIAQTSVTSNYSPVNLLLVRKAISNTNISLSDLWDSHLFMGFDSEFKLWDKSVSNFRPLSEIGDISASNNRMYENPINRYGSFPVTSTPMAHFRNTDSDNDAFWRATNGSGTGGAERTTYFGAYGRVTGQPQASLNLSFGNNPFVPENLKGEVCTIDLELPKVQSCDIQPPELSNFKVAPGYVDNPTGNISNGDFIIEDDGMGNRIDQCGVGSPTSSTRFSMERENFKYDTSGNATGGMIISSRIYNRSTCESGDYSIDNGTAVTARIEIDNRTQNARRCVANHSDVVWRDDYVEFRDVEVKAGTSKELRVECSFNESKPNCADPNNDVSFEVSNAMGTDRTSDGEYKRCMLPTFFFNNDAQANDGNADNDSDPGIYTTAYPFEFQQCNQNIENEWNFRYEGGCGIIDEDYKDFTLQWNPGTNVEGDLIQNVSGNNINGVSPTVSGNTVNWNFDSGSLSDLLDTDYYARVTINTRDGERQRLEGNNFRLINNQTSKISLECDDSVDNNCNGNDDSTSRGLSSAIGLDPEIGNEKIYDLGIYDNPDDQTVIMHKQEINELSKKGNLSGDGHREPVIYEVDITNPAQNTLYGLGDLDFNLRLNPNNNAFDDFISTKPNIGSDIGVPGGNPGWDGQLLSPGDTSMFKGYFRLDPTLNSLDDDDNGITGNNTKSSNGLASLSFDRGLSCDYEQGFNDWEVEVINNPLTIQEIDITDPDPTPEGNQHLPGDLMHYTVLLNNNNNNMDYENVYVEFEFNDNTNISDSNLELDLENVFEIDGGISSDTDPYYGIPLYDTNGGKESCGIEGTKVICIINEKINSGSNYELILKKLIKIKDGFYQHLKASTTDEKYWYPINLEEVRYGTPDLNTINHSEDGNIIHYTSDLNNIPSGDIRGDILNNDINDPSITPTLMPDKGQYNYYIGMPYMDINTNVINTAIGHFSPGDIVEFQTTVESKSKSYIRNPKITQKMFKDQLMDFVNVDVVDMEYIAEKTNFNTTNKRIDVLNRNTDTDPTNDIPASNIISVELTNDNSGVKEAELIVDKLNFFTDGPIAAYYDGTETPDTDSGGEVVINTKVLIKALKNSKKPQIGCGINESIGCERGGSGEGENPKTDFTVGEIDLESVGTAVDENAEEDYQVYFPILKSILFQRENQSYIPTAGSNENIRGVINDPNTEVAYRIDNFIPSGYNTNEGIGKARNPMAFIRLPVGVKYTPNSLKIIEGLSDTAPYGNETALPYEPVVTSKTEYEAQPIPGTNTFEGDLDGRDPNAELLPSPEEMIDEQIGDSCLYGEGVYGICILGL